MASLDELCLEQAVRQVRLLRQSGFDLQGKLALEIGPGPKPVHGCVFRMAGCRRVILCDLHRHMNVALTLATVRQLGRRAAMIDNMLEVPAGTVERALPEKPPHNLAALMQECGLEYRAPFDVRRTDILAEQIDVITSRAVLEHVPADDLRTIMREMRRIIRSDGAMVHMIDHSDHWQHFDRSISRINFLKFSDWSWRALNPPLAYQNRLRSPDYLAIVRDAGFEISTVELSVDPGALADTHALPIHAAFNRYSAQELATTTTFLVARPRS